jgi:hypothetical protein
VGWVSRARRSRAPGDNCTSAYCLPSYDDSHWRTLDLPHDWSIEDLPTRQEDGSTPVLEVRNGTWRFQPGDNPAYSQAGYNDSSWAQVSVPHDWRLPPTSYTQRNATAWYRRNVTVDDDALAAAARGSLRLALGAVSSQDDTYVNGHKVGSSGGSSCQDFLAYRSYEVGASPFSLGLWGCVLRRGSENLSRPLSF